MRIYTVFFIFFFSWCYASKTLVCIAGGAKKSDARTIGDYYEYGLTVQFCQAVQEVIMQKSKQNRDSVTVIVLKEAEYRGTYALCEYVNKLRPFLTIHFGFYMQPEETPTVQLFYYGHEYEKARVYGTELALLSVDSAHLSVLEKSRIAAQSMASFFKESPLQARRYVVDAVGYIPFLQLKGMNGPACACEIGIAHPYGWKKIVEDVAHAVYTMLDAL